MMMALVVLVVVVVIMMAATVTSFPVVPVPPSVSIVVHVRSRQEIYWDAWQLNSNVCPPSLCSPFNEPGKDEVDGSVPPPTTRPLGTGGSAFFQGDILLDKEVDRYIFPQRYRSASSPEDVKQTGQSASSPLPNGQLSRAKRATVKLRNRLWKDGVVPYVFGDKLSAHARRMILKAFKHFTQRSCITFRKRNESDADYVQFISDPGCWSSIGRTGGKQLLSLGRGCETVGTAVHEIFHSLGVWHEQARNDRDQYVEVLEENISDRFLDDFNKISEEVSTSRGFPYDYSSIMHYSRFAFTRNGEPTIKVIGVGRELGLTLRQRNGLSTIDIAQLRTMYRCNLFTDTQQSSCPEGWFKQETSCYKFFPQLEMSFPQADRKCSELNSHLVFIETRREDKFLAGHLSTEFPAVSTWRTGGRDVNGTMKWYREDSNPEDLVYTNWGKGQPSTRTSLALKRNPRSNVTRWIGVHTGSLYSKRHYTFPFICERRARRNCLALRHTDGRDYRGKLDHTVDGHTCQKWTEHYPHTHNVTDPAAANDVHNDEDRDKVAQDRDGLGNHNFCRNPRSLRRSRPWCFTAKRHPEWQLCDVIACSSDSSEFSQKSPQLRY